MRRMNARVFIAWLFLAFANTATANSVDWAAGQESFGNGDYQSALRYFESERDSGRDGPAVHYNIAVCQFKLGRFERAGDSFQLIANRFPKMRGLANYNLGLVALRKGDNEAARRHFLNAYEESPDNRKLRILSSNRLRELTYDMPIASGWSGVVGLRAGFDDNVALRDEVGLPAGTTTESPVIDVFASIQGPWDKESGFRVDASLYVIRNFDADDFDQTEIRSGALYDWRADAWRVQVGGHYSAGTLGGDAFDRKAGVNARAVRYLSDNSSVDLHFSYDEVTDADALFAGIAGSRQQLQARYRWHSTAHRLILQYMQESNHRDDPGVSPDRNGFTAKYRYQPGAGWGFEGGIGFRSSDYDDLDVPRSEDLFTTHLALTRELADDWMVLLEYRYSDNDSSDLAFSYDRNQISLGAMWAF